MITGIVAEFNPFHNGHKYLVGQARKASCADAVVAVMSGSFVQRGEPAILNKWARTEMALENGVDLVVELPVYYSVQSAEFFARGAIETLNVLGTDCVCFGVETDDRAALTAVAEILREQPEWYTSALRSALSEGISFPAARQKALGDLGQLVTNPNNILAVEYIKAGAKNPLPIKRIGVHHDSSVTTDNIASASYLRRNPEPRYFPSYHIIEREQESGLYPVTMSALGDAIMMKLRTDTSGSLNNICDVSEGLENRIYQQALMSTSLDELIGRVKTKRYTHSRLRRIMINYMLGITKDIQGTKPAYIHVLGGNKKGFSILENAHLPVILKASGFKHRLFEYDIKATDLYTMLYPDEKNRIGAMDYYKSVIYKN